MVQKDLCNCITSEFSNYLEPISLLSKSTEGKVLVRDERKLYNFDKITQKVYNNTKVPSSADALLISSRGLLLTEFKSGFKRKISEETIDYSRLTCPDDNTKICKDYAKLLIDKGKLETSELLDSLKFKAIESFVTLEKKLFSLCSGGITENKHVKVIFCVVIDDYIDSMEDTLTELADKPAVSNTLSNVRLSLSRFVGLKTTDGKDYFYDEVKVLSPYEYTRYIDRFTT
ncbi:MAG: hypothetical protein K2H52_15410 [Lachnospiraceae bacterium]|nr:hypothetical protein [Lachnospiraceae bacterium]